MDRNLTFNYETFACDWPTMEGICCQEIKKTKIKWALDADAKQETCKVATGMVHHPEHHLGISIHCVWKNMFFSLTDRHRKKILEYFSTTGLANDDDDNNFIFAYLNFWRLIIFFFFFLQIFHAQYTDWNVQIFSFLFWDLHDIQFYSLGFHSCNDVIQLIIFEWIIKIRQQYHLFVFKTFFVSENKQNLSIKYFLV